MLNSTDIKRERMKEEILHVLPYIDFNYFTLIAMCIYYDYNKNVMEM